MLRPEIKEANSTGNMGLHTFPWPQTHSFSWYNINLGGERNRDLREPSKIRVYPKSVSRNETPSLGQAFLETHSLMGRAGSVEISLWEMN